MRTFICAFNSNDVLVISRSRFATLRAGTKNSGSMAMLIIARRQFSESIIDKVNSTLVALVMILMRVPVTAR